MIIAEVRIELINALLSRFGAAALTFTNGTITLSD